MRDSQSRYERGAHREDSIVLDVGAGTGSISIEAALAAPKGHVYAIERFDKGIDLINEKHEEIQCK